MKTILWIISFLIFFIFPTFSRHLSKTELRGLSVSAEADTVFTHKENCFVLTVHGVEPSDIQTDLSELPIGVKFVSSKRSEFIDDDGDRGTEIRFWFTFSDVGNLLIPPLIAKVEDSIIYIPFDRVFVYENPAVVSPVLSVEFVDRENINDFKVGETIRFEIYIQYCVQIIGMNVKIPKDSIFNEVSREEIVKGEIRNNDFTTEKFKVATFDWKPLIAGNYRLPEIEVDSIAYNGNRKKLALPSMKISVSDLQGNLSEEKEENSFNLAFEEKSENISNTTERLLTVDEIKKIVELRIKERNSFPLTLATKNRFLYEKELGLNNTDEEPSRQLFLVLAITSFVFVLFFVIFSVIKRPKSSVIFAFLSLFSIVSSVMQGMKIFPLYGVSVGGRISLVPELISDPNAPVRVIPQGQRVRIVEHIGDWVYVDCSEISGWTQSESILTIR